MKPLLNLFDKTKNAIFNAYSKDTSKMLLVTGTLGWMLSAAGQILGIANNKKIDKKEKNFLIPQEIADAAINICSYFFVTLSIQNMAKRIVSKGGIITPKIKAMCEKYNVSLIKDKEGNPVNIGKYFAEKISDLETTIKVNKQRGLDTNSQAFKKLENELKELKEFNDKTYSPLEGGVGVVGNVLGTILSSNIITPMLRNPMASWKQRTALEREDLERDAKLYRENKVILAQNSINMDDYRSRVLTSSSVSMKI